MNTANPARHQSLGEEVANSLTHGLALVAAIVGLPFLLIHASRADSPALVVGAGIFGATAILLYLASTLYHALPKGRAKRVFRVLDHSAIFLLIAGTYTPFALGVLQGPWGWTLLVSIWLLAAIGVTLKATGKINHPLASTGLYLLMGWLVLLVIKPLMAQLSVSGMGWLLAGGLAYTLGVIFFATDGRLKYGHFIWHLFVMMGTTSHFFAVLWHSG